MSKRTPYPYWSEEELEKRRLESRRQFVNRYSGEIQKAYTEVLAECNTIVAELLTASDDLRALKKGGKFFEEHKAFRDVGRYCTSPVVSADTMKIVGEAVGFEGTIVAFLDQDRFPWLGGKRSPKRGERDDAIRITAKIWAEPRSQTASRARYSKAQEARAKAALKAAGLTYVERAEIRMRLDELGDKPTEGLTASNWAEALRRGEFSDEIRLAGKKCDVPARLNDGRLLPIECKVSNTETNSTKRLIRETLGKHIDWRGTFGRNLVTGAVLGGAFSMVNLRQAQDEGMLLFFEHDLESLTALIKTGGNPRGA